MSNATIMLATNFDYAKVKYPVVVSEKLDGVPVKIYWDGHREGFVAITRQGNEVISIQHIINELRDFLKDTHCRAYVGELVKPNAPFEETSGLVRGKGQAPELVMYIYDSFGCDDQGDCIDKNFFSDRLKERTPLTDHVECVEQYSCVCAEDLDIVKEHVKKRAADYGRTGKLFEGWMVRSLYGNASIYKQGKRSLGMMRIVPEPTVDLRVIRVMEAVDKYGNPKETIGSLVCIDKSGIELKVGAGCMDFAQRKYYWDNTSDIIGEIVVVKYKPSTYGKLRQPTFQRFHFDKTEPDNI